MGRFMRILLAGLILRCPQCQRGALFAHGFTINTICPQCGLQFEPATGEVTGGMGINISVTLVPVMVVALILGLNPAVPLLPLLAGLGLFSVLFPIAFYRSARGLWIAILYLTGNTNEGD